MPDDTNLNTPHETHTKPTTYAERRRRSRRTSVAPDAPLMTVPEWSRRYGFACTTTRKFIAEGMPAISVDRHVRIEPARAIEWLRARSEQRRTETA